MIVTPISDLEFSQFQKLIYQLAGIHLSAEKKALVCGRLAKRLEQYGFGSYAEYFKLLTAGHNAPELQVAVDLLTTNETYFFREPRHFDFLRERALPAHKPGRPGHPFRAWSAACSSGEEPYSVAMLLADHFGDTPWEVVASDISTRVLEKALKGHYPMDRTDGISREHLSRYCLKGVGSQAGTLLVDRKLRSRVNFMQVNLSKDLPALGEFDLILLRNVMIYFDMETKRQVVRRLLPLLKSGGHFLIGHSESLNGVVDGLRLLAPAIYQKP
jgi:chemotaxis protein methyltransferase CheR